MGRLPECALGHVLAWTLAALQGECSPTPRLAEPVQSDPHPTCCGSSRMGYGHTKMGLPCRRRERCVVGARAGTVFRVVRFRTRVHTSRTTANVWTGV
eukprot:364455-Chlamydomonas_euryale.AAC.6